MRGPTVTLMARQGVGAAMAPFPGRARNALLLALFVLASSILGLVGRGAPGGNPGDPLGFVASVWSASLLADAVFVLGSIGGLLIALRIAREGGLALGCLASLGAQALVYIASFTLLLQSWPGPRGMPVDFYVITPLQVGIVGLAFCGLVPAAARKLGVTEAQSARPAAQ